MAERTLRTLRFPTGGLPKGWRPQRRTILMLSVLVALLALVSIVGVLGFYVVTRKPVTELPVVDLVTRGVPPRRLFSFVGMARPVGIAVSPDGQRVYVAEGGGDRLIKVFNRDGQPVGQMAPPNTGPGARKPSHLATDAGGRLYVNDRLRAAVDVYSPNLQWERAVESSAVNATGGWLPNGVSVGPDGRLYVTEVGHQEHSVLVLTPDGSLVSRLDSTTGLPGKLSYPVQAVADDAGRIYIGDGQGGRILVVGKSKVNQIGVNGPEALTVPIGLAVAGQKLFVADAAAHRIAVFAVGDQPQYLYSFGDTDDDEGLAYPMAVTVDRTGRIYIADRTNDRVQVWSH